MSYNVLMVRVHLFASLKDAAGESPIRLEVDDVMTAQEVFERLCVLFPDLDEYRKFTSVAVNEQNTTWSQRIKSGDEVAFFPPVSGGAG